MLVAPKTNPDHNLALNWRPSVEPGGTPGGSDSTVFSGDPAGDDDLNGVSNLMQYAMWSAAGSTLLPAASAQSIAVDNVVAEYLSLTYQQNLAADDVLLELQVSNNLIDWNSGPGSLEFVSRTNNGDGTATLVYRSASPIDSAVRQFVRLLAMQR